MSELLRFRHAILKHLFAESMYQGIRNFCFAQVKWWITINEPDNIVKGYTTEAKAPALNLGELSAAAFRVAHHALLIHGRIYRLYDKTYRAKQNGKKRYYLI